MDRDTYLTIELQIAKAQLKEIRCCDIDGATISRYMLGVRIDELKKMLNL